MNTTTKRSFWTVAAEQLAAERMSKTLLLVVGSIPANDTTVVPVKSTKEPKVIEIRNMRGHEYHADVMPKKSIRLHGFEHNHVKPHAYDITFKVGDVAVYGGMNLTYTGKIASIGEKTVKIAHNDRTTVLKFDDFNFWNNDFNAKKIAKENAEEFMCI